MNVSTWSRRRVVLLWVGGLALQAALIALPLWLALSNAPRARAQWASLSERMGIGERAESLSVASQRAKGAVGVTPAGDSLYAVVHMPSGRTTDSVASPIFQLTRSVLGFLYVFGIPITLVVLTIRWRQLRA